MSTQGSGVDISITTPLAPSTPMPRSRRVGMASPPSGFKLAMYTDSSSPPPSPTSTASPPVPARSPLRPPPRRSLVDSTPYPDSPTIPSFRDLRLSTPPPLDSDLLAIAEPTMPLSFPMRNRSFPSLNGHLDGVHPNPQDSLNAKPLTLRPESPLPLSPMDDEPASSTSSLVQPPTMTKRQHALHELLSSERAYASDLALIREVHIPLALGQTVPLHSTPATPPNSSGSSSRTLSTASDSSTASLGPPMTLEDTRIIFSNVAELAIFSDIFCEQIEEALGSVLEGGQGQDHVGALFLQIIPDLERPYKQYITKHPTALTHLGALPQTPALTSYLTYTQTVASSLSHAWDLASLLIKPVQRLLKYSLLLGAIIDETPDSHPDKQNLKLAKQKMEEVARNVNEGRRRAEVVKEVLTAKKKGVGVGVAASVNLSKMKSLRVAKAHEGNEEAAQVERMQAELKRIDGFAKEFAKNVVDWARMMNVVVMDLRVWAVSFGKVIGLSEDQGSEAFDAFLTVVEQQLMPLCVGLEAVITDKLLREIARLLATMNQPLKLLASMNEQEPFHYHLMNMNVSPKNRPPAALLEASTNYLALRGQLCAELPQYLALLHKGMASSVRKLAEIQTQFWGDVRDRWGDLWEMLRVEGEMNAGADETVFVWEGRWAEVDQIVDAMHIVNPKKLYYDPLPLRSTGSNVSSVLSSLDPPASQSKRLTPPAPMNMLSSLEPAHVSAPLPLTPHKGRARGNSDASTPASRKNLGRRSSNESLRSGKKSTRSRGRPDEFGEYVAVMPMTAMPIPVPVPMQPRTKSMPTLTPDSSSGRSFSSSRVAMGHGEEDVASRHESYDDRERGRTVRKPSLRRKITESLRTNSHQRRRSPSAKSLSSTLPQDSYFATDPDAPPTPNSGTTTFSNANRNSWAQARAKYLCQVVHPCRPPASVSYFSFPFFTLVEGDVFEVLQEAGHPSVHPKLPLHVDDGADCLLLVRDYQSNVGWALASFLIPLDNI